QRECQIKDYDSRRTGNWFSDRGSIPLSSTRIMPGILAVARISGIFFDLLGLGDVILYLDHALYGQSGPKCDP
ncbi:hypothetical protein, partial [Enterocloster asparagiformis]